MRRSWSLASLGVACALAAGCGGDDGLSADAKEARETVVRFNNALADDDAVAACEELTEGAATSFLRLARARGGVSSCPPVVLRVLSDRLRSTEGRDALVGEVALRGDAGRVTVSGGPQPIPVARDGDGWRVSPFSLVRLRVEVKLATACSALQTALRDAPPYRDALDRTGLATWLRAVRTYRVALAEVDGDAPRSPERRASLTAAREVEGRLRATVLAMDRGVLSPEDALAGRRDKAGPDALVNRDRDVFGADCGNPGA